MRQGMHAALLYRHRLCRRHGMLVALLREAGGVRRSVSSRDEQGPIIRLLTRTIRAVPWPRSPEPFQFCNRHLQRRRCP